MNDNRLSIWVIYDHPTDFPDKFVAREWRGEEATGNLIICDEIDMIREMMMVELGRVKLDRHPTDDPKIVETWI